MMKKPDLDEPTLRIMGALVRMKPKHHEDMKVGKATKKASRKAATPKKRKDQK